MTAAEDIVFMRRALALAQTQSGKTGANPSVGCVVVKNGVVLGEAATAMGGRPHAEEQALRGADAQGADVYVTLEPCAQRSHGGASCSDLLARARVARVVIACADPHPLAAGAGPAKLRAAGIAVEIGLCETEARALNAAFFASLGG